MMITSGSQVKEDEGREEALIRSLMTGHTPTNYRV